jgi:hypothetical protein
MVNTGFMSLRVTKPRGRRTRLPLRAGFPTRKDGRLGPCEDMIFGKALPEPPKG